MTILDLVASAICGWLALCVFVLHIISSPRRHNWFTLPEYIRVGLFLTGALFMWRSVNLLTLTPATTLGHVNLEALLSLAGITYTVTALTYHYGSRFLFGRSQDRLRWAEKVMHDDPSMVTVMLPADTAIEVLRALGANAVPPDAPPEALVRPVSATH